MKMYQTLRLEKSGTHTHWIMLNRPEIRNAVNRQMLLELKDFFSNFEMDQKPDPRVVVLTGAGDKAFSAGADLKERNNLTDKLWLERHKIVEEVGELIMNFPLPIIAAVNGAAFGGGCELAMLCDFIIASENASFAQPEAKLGFIPGLHGTQRLPRVVGPGRAKEMLYTGRSVSAEEALRWGLINQIVPLSELRDRVEKIAESISMNGPIAIREIKWAVDKGLDQPISDAIQTELKAYRRAVKTSDRTEGVRAFNEKRAPNFKNR